MTVAAFGTFDRPTLTQHALRTLLNVSDDITVRTYAWINNRAARTDAPHYLTTLMHDPVRGWGAVEVMIAPSHGEPYCPGAHYFTGSSWSDDEPVERCAATTYYATTLPELLHRISAFVTGVHDEAAWWTWACGVSLIKLILDTIAETASPDVAQLEAGLLTLAHPNAARLLVTYRSWGIAIVAAP